MPGCNLQSNGSVTAQQVTCSRSWSLLPNACQALRRNFTSAKASASATSVHTLVSESAPAHSHPSSLGRWLATDEAPASTTSFTQHPEGAANGALAGLLHSKHALTMQQLSTEISRLVTELETELNGFLASTHSLSQPHPHQREPPPTATLLPQPHRPRVSVSQRRGTPTPPLRVLDGTRSPPLAATGGGSGGIDAAANVFDPLAHAAAAIPPQVAHGPTGLPPLLSLSLPVIKSPRADGGGGVGVGADAGSRAERRKQKNLRQGSGAVAAVSIAPEHETKFKVTGNGSITILIGSFSNDHVLNSEEEQRLAAAAQDFMQLTDLGRVLGAVIRRPPSMAELAKTLSCEEGTLRVRLDCGNRARTLLAQRNYRLVVNIAKKLVRSGGAAAAAAAGGGAAAAGASSHGESGVSLDDAITVGMEALMYAIRKFKPEAGYRLSTYATWWIRLYISRMVHAQAGVISLSVYQRSNLDRLRAARAQLRTLLPPGVAPTAQQLAEATGLSLGQLTQLEGVERAFGRGVRSFEAPVLDGDGERGLTVEDLVGQDTDAELSEGLASSLFQDSEDFAASASLSASVDALLASLDRGEAELLRKQYGLGGDGRDGDGGGAGWENAKEGKGPMATGLGRKAAVASGAQRLKLGRPASRLSATQKALEKLRVTAAEEGSPLGDLLELTAAAKPNYATRSGAGYSKKSKG